MQEVLAIVTALEGFIYHISVVAYYASAVSTLTRYPPASAPGYASHYALAIIIRGVPVCRRLGQAGAERFFQTADPGLQSS